MATRREAEPKMVEEKILRASDLEGMKGKYSEFMKNNNALKEEFYLLNKKKLTLKQWKLMTKKQIMHYLAQDIKLTPRYYDSKGRSLFHKRV